MDFLVFDSTGKLIFIRDDAESAVHVEEEFRLSASFPYITSKLLKRGQRIVYTDQENIFQCFETREASIDEPDEAQEIECEHIVVAELTDEIIEDKRPTNTTAANALASILQGTQWQVGTVVPTEVNSMRAYYKDAWSAVCMLRDTWGVRIRPRVTVGETGITGRYIDISSCTPTFRGVRLEINKNIEQAGVIYDDRALYTAMYGRGKGKSTVAGDATNAQKLSFEDVVWTIAGGAPANKPAGQKWIEDTAATAMYGRNGRRRTGIIEFSSEENAEILLQRTWDYLQTVNKPRVTINCTLLDMYPLGYQHEQILLGDEVAVIIDPIGVELKATVAKMPRDLVQPENTKPTIGNYRASIEYITRQNSRAADIVERLTNSNPDLINGVLNTMVTAILSTGTKFYTDPTDGSFVWETSDGTQAVRNAGAGILLAASKIAGVWQWRTAITGNGMVADEITVGTLRTALVKIFGNDNFFWDAANIVCKNPNNTNQEIRFGLFDGIHYGIGFTSDGGATWDTAIDFAGINFNVEGLAQQITALADGLTTTVSRLSTIEQRGIDTQNDLNAKYTELKQTENDFTVRIVNAEGKVTGLEGDTNNLKNFKAMQETYFKVAPEGAIVGQSGVPTSVLVAANRVAIRDQYNNEVTKITDNQMEIENAIIRKQMTVGFVSRTKLSDGSCGDKWIGVEA